MTDMLNKQERQISLNWAYTRGRCARAQDYPPESCPRNFDELHKAEWRRGYNEQE